jgi:phage terminase large subunit-like protein
MRSGFEMQRAPFRPLNAEGSTLDGLNMHFGSVDELHAHKRRDVWDVLATATGSRSQPLLWAITTAGSDRSGMLLRAARLRVQVAAGRDRATTPTSGSSTRSTRATTGPKNGFRAKANPNLGVSVGLDDLRAKARFAMQMPSAQSNFLTKHLNVWVNADSAWMDMRAWERCADHGLRLEDFAGRPCWIGMDLAEKHDFAALLLAFERGDLVYVFPRFYLNEHAIQSGANWQYDGWARAGHIVVNGGNATDFDAIADDLRQFCQRFEVREIPFDPALSQVLRDQAGRGRPAAGRGAPGAAVFHAAADPGGEPGAGRQAEIRWQPGAHLDGEQRRVRTSRITQLQHPVKTRDENKIDGAVAMFLALGRMMTQATSEA